jgi:hypothetical protein
MSVAIRGLSHPFLGGLAPVDGNVSPTNTMNAIFGDGKWKPNKNKLALVRLTGGADPDSQQVFIEDVPLGGKISVAGIFAGAGILVGYFLGRR